MRQTIYLWVSALSLGGFLMSASAQRPREEVALELIQRWDTNRDGVLAADEIPARARPAIERLSREAGLKIDEGLPLDRVSQHLRKQSSSGDKPAAGPSGSRPSDGPTPSESDAGDSKPSQVERPTRGFGTSAEKPAPRGFGESPPSRETTSVPEDKNAPDANPRQESANDGEPGRTNPDDRVQRYAEVLLRRYDRNRNGVLEKEEWSRMRGDPARSDTNKDGVLTVDELSVQLAAYGRSSRTASQSRGGTTTTDARPAEGTRAPRENARFVTATERLAEKLPRELLDWFLQKDRDGDGQVAMSEFSSAWSVDRVREFVQLDLDNDGLITPREYTKARTGR